VKTDRRDAKKLAELLRSGDLTFQVQQIVLEEYRDAVRQAEERVKGLDEEMRKSLATWSLKDVTESESLMALKGVQLITAMSVTATRSFHGIGFLEGAFVIPS
jgi:transposase